MTFVPKPKLVKPFSANFTNVGSSEERLHLSWTYPLGVFGEFSFLVGTECFLETATDIASVPEEHLLASISMAAILAGEVLPGSVEYLDAVTEQNTKNFQTIVGEVRLKPEAVGFKNPQPVDDLSIGPPGTVFDIVFQRGTGTNLKTVRADAWTLSQYGNRVDEIFNMVYVVPGAVHKALGFKKSQLGAADSANRQAVIDFIQAQYFWV